MNGNVTRIRKAKVSDVSVLSGLIRGSFHDVAERFGITPENCPKHPSNCTDKWIENDFIRGVSYYILENDGLSQGCVALEKSGLDTFYLERLAVLPEARGRGCGGRLVRRAFAEAKALGAKEISIGVITGEKKLRDWYKKIGFLEEKTKKFKHLPFLVTFLRYTF